MYTEDDYYGDRCLMGCYIHVPIQCCLYMLFIPMTVHEVTDSDVLDFCICQCVPLHHCMWLSVSVSFDNSSRMWSSNITSC